MQRNGIGVVFRLIPEGVQTPAGRGLPEDSPLDLIDVSEGLILVTGTYGNGQGHDARRDH